MKFLFLFLYLTGGKPILEQQYFDSLEECRIVGESVVDRKMTTGADQFLFAGCGPVQVQEVERKGSK